MVFTYCDDPTILLQQLQLVREMVHNQAERDLGVNLLSRRLHDEPPFRLLNPLEELEGLSWAQVFVGIVPLISLVRHHAPSELGVQCLATKAQ